MNFRPITLRKKDDTFIKFNPENIDNIIIDVYIIIIYYFEDEYFDSNPKEYILNKSDYNYTAWDYFKLQLNRIFEIE